MLSDLSAQFAFYDSLSGIYWAQIEPPSGEQFGSCQILREGLGYLSTSTGTLYEYDASRPQRWRRLPRPEPYTIGKYFALAPDDIWAVVEVLEIYKQVLFHWDGKNWSRVSSPNVYNIRDLLFTSPEEGWLACEYGELWHYFRGKWQQEKLPLFIHVNKLSFTADDALYAACEAPDQVALLRGWQGKWQILFSFDFNFLPTTITLSPSNILLLGGIGFPRKNVDLEGQPARLMQLKDVQFFSNDSGCAPMGYGIDQNTIYLFQDTAYSALAQYPKGLSDLCLFNQRFSWIIGNDGLILAPQRQPISTPPQIDPAFGFREQDISHLYGMAVLQNQPGELSRLYFAHTGAPNSVYDFTDFYTPPLKIANHAPRLNLSGPEKYVNRHDANKDPLINYDHGIATGDLNGDGRDDIVVTSMYGHPFVYFNSGHDYYFDATAYSGLQSWGYVEQRPMLANLFDADHDGDLDLFIACQYQSNAFFINNGRGKFTEVTRATGLFTEGGGIGGYVADFDGDGWEDLYVTRVNRPNLMYRNLGPDSLTGLPRFADASAASGDACWPSLKQSQGVAVADYDNDGDLDLFVCNLLESNRLWQNNGKGFFTEVTAQARLEDNDQSVGATFFDADHDGDLDLVVANKGPDRFYKNNGDGTFTERSEYLGGPRFAADVMHTSRHFGGNSSGTLILDLDQDADLDVLISNYDTGLFVFRNQLNNRESAIQIFPEGIVSNRSAVGAKVFLYESGKMNDPDRLVGLRMIESANSYGCSPAKMAHFGVDPEKTYEAKIIFPSGIVREIEGLRGGDRLLVPELQGLAANAIKAQHTLSNLLFGYRSREGFGVLLSGAMLLILMLLAGRKIVGLSAYDQKVFAGVYASVFLVCFILWFARDHLTFVARPLVSSAGLSVLVMIYLHTKRLYQARPASLEMLQMRLNAFGHGTMIHDLMNRLAFYAENFDAAVALPTAGRARLLEAIRGLLHSLTHEIRAILRYQYGNNFAMDLAFRLEATWAKLKKALARLRRSFETGEKLEPTRFTEIATLQQQLREQVATIKKRFDEQYYVDVNAVITELLRQGDYPGVRFTPSPRQIRARITDADLSYVLDELVQNALRHIDEQPAQIDITVHHAYDELHIDVQDNGSGIPQHLWEEIFRFGFTTRPAGKGGFGLYHARQRLEKYGGKIFVAASEMGRGATMRICLKADL